MTISREKCLGWANMFFTNYNNLTKHQIKEAYQAAYDEGQRNMQKRAVKVCMNLERKERDHATGYGPGYLIYTVSDCEVEIRKLKIE